MFVLFNETHSTAAQPSVVALREAWLVCAARMHDYPIFGQGEGARGAAKQGLITQTKNGSRLNCGHRQLQRIYAIDVRVR